LSCGRRVNSTFDLSRKAAEKFLANGSTALRDTCSILELLTLQMLEIDLKNLVDAGMQKQQTRTAIKQSLYDCIEAYGNQFVERFNRWREAA